MTDIKLKKTALLEKRKAQLSALLGTQFEKIIERFITDLLGCLSGGSNERAQAREWLLFCFHQYFGCGDYDKDNQRLEDLRELLDTFSEPTNQELEDS